MSSNKTIIPGMQDAFNDHNSGFARSNGKNSFETFFGNPSDRMTRENNSKPIVGFLYSISRTHSGEFWPLHIGANSIGRSECDICLREATVSEKHATLVIRQMKNPEKLIASLCDSQSTCGTMINGESLGFEQRECFNGDIITIGEHYDLFLIVINAKEIGLRISTDFMPVQAETHNKQSPNRNNSYSSPMNHNKFTQGFGPEDADNEGGTVGMDDYENGSPTSPNPDSTIF